MNSLVRESRSQLFSRSWPSYDAGTAAYRPEERLEIDVKTK
jgi:hypothetical protein